MTSALDLLMDSDSTVETTTLLESNGICTIDSKTRTIFVPSEIVVGAVQSDKNAERIKFSCPKIVGDNLDLSKFSIRINFENVSSVDPDISIKDQYICEDASINEDNITFSWVIGKNAARYMGTIRFIVCAVKTDSDSNISIEWNTTVAQIPVLEGIEVDQPSLDENNKDIINQLLAITKTASDEAVKNVNSAKEQAITDIQNVLQPDKTLTVEGGIADAKATGNAISSLREDIIYKPYNYDVYSLGMDYKEIDTNTLPFEDGGFNDTGTPSATPDVFRLTDISFDKPLTIIPKDNFYVKALEMKNGIVVNILFIENPSISNGLYLKAKTVYKILFRKNDHVVCTLDEIKENFNFYLENDTSNVSRKLNYISKRVLDIPFTIGSIDTSGLNVYADKTIRTVTYHSPANGDAYIVEPSLNSALIVVEYDSNYNFISRNVYRSKSIINTTYGHCYRFVIYNSKEFPSSSFCKIEVVSEKYRSLLSYENAVNEIPLIFKNGTFNGAGSDAVNAKGVSTEKITTNDGKIYLFTFPDGYESLLNNKFKDSDIRVNTARMSTSYSISEYSDFIRFALYKKNNDDISVDTISSDLKNVHLYEIDCNRKREYDVYLSTEDSVKKGNFQLSAENTQPILQGLINCFNSIKIYLYGGTYNLSTLYTTKLSGQKAFLFTNEFSNKYHTIEIKGDNCSRTADDNFVKIKINYDINLLSDADENSGILVPRRDTALDTQILTNTLLKVNNIAILGCGYTKPIVYLDSTYAQASMLENVMIRGDGSLSGLQVFPTKPNEDCVGIRVGYGSNNGIQNYVKHCMVYFLGKGFSVCGEHYILEDDLAHHCYYGFAFGDKLTRGNYEHPNIMIGCSIEGCYRLMYLSKYGEKTEREQTYAENTLVCIGLSTECRWDIPSDELTPNGEKWQSTKPIFEVIKGMYRGRIEADYRGKNISIFETNNSGKNMVATTY